MMKKEEKKWEKKKKKKEKEKNNIIIMTTYLCCPVHENLTIIYRGNRFIRTYFSKQQKQVTNVFSGGVKMRGGGEGGGGRVEESNDAMW